MTPMDFFIGVAVLVVIVILLIPWPKAKKCVICGEERDITIVLDPICFNATPMCEECLTEVEDFHGHELERL